MRAKVKPDARYPSVRSAGIIFTRVDWVDVPAWAEKEISACPYLEVETIAPVEVVIEPEPEPAEEAQTPASKAVKLVDVRQARAKGKRKL